MLKSPAFAKQLNVLDTAGYMTLSDRALAKGEWMTVNFTLTNLQAETSRLWSWDDALIVQGELNGNTVSFSPSDWGTSRGQRNRGISNWIDEVPPGISITAVAIYDINPAANNLRLVLRPEKEFDKIACTATIDLEEAPISFDKPVAIADNNVNIRTGPGTNYPVAGKARTGQRFEIVGKNTNATWWHILYDGKKVWLAASVSTTAGPFDNVPIAKDIPSPPATPTPFPKVRPDQELTVGKWGLKLYDVKKAKTVYWFGDGEIANGVWLTPLIEFRNLGSGTASPMDDLDFYLQDSSGRRYNFDPFNDAVLGAAWEYQTGKLYGDIDPGIVIGTATPFDVPLDMGDVWLRVKQNPGLVMYLGNVSQLPSEHQ